MPQEDKKNMTKALVTWEEIAIFLRVSVTTAKSYARMGMPVKRPGGKIVRAFPDELESWQRKQP